MGRFRDFMSDFRYNVHPEGIIVGILLTAGAVGVSKLFSYDQFLHPGRHHASKTSETETSETSLEYILQSQKIIPEEFYIQLFGSDDFLPISYDENCLQNNCHARHAFSLLLDEKTDLYSFALQSINSGRMPRNRAGIVSKLHDRTVTWLDAIRTLTKLNPDDAHDQEIIRRLIAANYALFLNGQRIKPRYIFFTPDDSGKINDIKYNGPNADSQFSVQVYTDGYYENKSDAWIPTNPTVLSFSVTNPSGHLILPVTSENQQMLHIPDTLLRDDITTVTATVPIRGKSYTYSIPLTEIAAELQEAQLRRNSGFQDWSANQIITSSLEKVVVDVIGHEGGHKQKLNALLSYLQTVPYSHSNYNSSPLVTVVAGGMCGATSGQFGVMLELAGISDYGFVYFKSPDSAHVGVYVPKEPNNNIPSEQVAQYMDKYWYIETTNGKKEELIAAILRYGNGEAYFYKKYPTADIRQQMRQENKEGEDSRRNCSVPNINLSP